MKERKMNKENNDRAIISKIIEYNTRYNLNFSELSVVLEINKDMLNYIVSESPELKYVDKNIFTQLEKIRNSKDEKIDRLKTLKASVEYTKEKKILKNMAEIIKKCHDKDYKITDEDIKHIAVYRIKYSLSQQKVADMLNITPTALSRKEQKIDDINIIEQLNELNKNNNPHSTITRKGY